MFKAKVIVTLKKGVADPQGLTVHNALKTLQYSGVNDVRIGKYVEFNVNSVDEEEAKTQIQSICEKLLVNPIIEQYRYELEKVVG